MAAFNAVREVGGDTLVTILLGQAGLPELADGGSASDRVSIEDYIRYRNTALEFLQESFASTAFQTGQLLVRGLKGHRKERQINALVEQFKHAASKLPLIGQAAVLASKGNPGTVRAAMRGDALVITIEDCPECRGLRREAPFCYLNQGVTTEFASTHLGLEIETREVRCTAMGHPYCEIEVTLPRG